jgi:predicted phosphodiesterase
MPAIKTHTTAATRIGFLADTHCRKDDASDFPQQAMDALAGAGLIVHLGNVGKDSLLTRLATNAPVITPKRGAGEVIEAGGLRVGITFDLIKLGVAGRVDETGLELVDGAVSKAFGGDVQAVAFAATHRELKQEQAGVVFFNPGSPTLPSDRKGDNDIGSVAVMDVRDGRAEVQLVRLSKA